MKNRKDINASELVAQLSKCIENYGDKPIMIEVIFEGKRVYTPIAAIKFASLDDNVNLIGCYTISNNGYETDSGVKS